MTTSDVDDLRRHLDTIIRAAHRLRPHLPDLHSIGWEPATPDPDTTGVDADRRGKTDWAPRAGDPRARRLLDHIATVTERAASDLAGAAGVMDRLLGADRPIWTPQSRGLLVSRSDLEEARDAQSRRKVRGEYSPVPLVDQPGDPGKNRP